MKKVLAFIFAVGMMCSISACGNNNKNSNSNSSSSTASSSQSQTSSNSSSSSNSTTKLENGATLNVNGDVINLSYDESGVKVEAIYTFSGDTLTSLKMRLSVDKNQEGATEAMELIKKQLEEKGYIIEKDSDSSMTLTASDSELEASKKQYPSKDSLISQIKNNSSANTNSNK